MNDLLMEHIGENQPKKFLNPPNDIENKPKPSDIENKSETESIASTNKSKVSKDELQFFKEKVMQWLKLEKQIKELSKEMANLRKVKNKELEPKIVEFMKEHNLTDLKTSSGKLEYKTKITKKPINKKTLESALISFISNDKLGDAVNKIMEERESTEKHTLKSKK